MVLKLILQLMELDAVGRRISLPPKLEESLKKLSPRLPADLLVEKQDSSGFQDIQEAS